MVVENDGKEADDDFDPYQHREVYKPTNDLETLINLVKGCCGTGILAMPQAFKFVGLFHGAVTTVLFGMLTTYAVHIMVQAEYKCCKAAKIGLMDYPKCVRKSLEVGPQCFRKCATFIMHLVDILMVVMQLGTGCVYIVFVGVNTKQFVDAFDGPEFNDSVWMCLLVPAFMAIILVPNLKLLTPFTTVANIFTLISFLIIMYYIFEKMPPIGYVSMARMTEEYALYFGTAIFALTSPSLITAVENNMKTPQNFLGCFGVLNISMAIVIFMYTILGFCGYWKYGSATADSITLNIPEELIPAKVAIFLYILAIYFSYGLQCYVANSIIWKDYLVKHFPGTEQKRLRIYETVFRITSVLLTLTIAATIPLLGLIISFIGALCMSSLQFIFPCWMDICIRWPDDFGRWKWRLTRDILYIILGILGVFLGCGVSAYEMIVKLA